MCHYFSIFTQQLKCNPTNHPGMCASVTYIVNLPASYLAATKSLYVLSGYQHLEYILTAAKQILILLARASNQAISSCTCN